MKTDATKTHPKKNYDKCSPDGVTCREDEQEFEK